MTQLLIFNRKFIHTCVFRKLYRKVTIKERETWSKLGNLILQITYIPNDIPNLKKLI